MKNTNPEASSGLGSAEYNGVNAKDMVDSQWKAHVNDGVESPEKLVTYVGRQITNACNLFTTIAEKEKKGEALEEELGKIEYFKGDAFAYLETKRANEAN